MGREIASLQPGWVKKDFPPTFTKDEDFFRIINFFVFHAFRPNRSSNGKTMEDYGWPKNVWRNTSEVGLKDVLLYTAGLHQRMNKVDLVTRQPITEETFVSCQKIDDMSAACQRALVQHDFTRVRGVNRIAIYNSEGNQMLSVFDHIRNALAHGRFTVYKDGMIAMESGKMIYVRERHKNKLDIRARMLIKKENLIEWIDIIESGRLDPKVVKEIEDIRISEKQKKKRELQRERWKAKES